MFESWKKKVPEEEPVEEVKEEAPIIEDPEAERSMSSASADAVADLEQQLGGGEDVPPVLDDEGAERKLRENTDKDNMSAAQKREEKKRVEEGETGSL